MKKIEIERIDGKKEYLEYTYANDDIMKNVLHSLQKAIEKKECFKYKGELINTVYIWRIKECKA